ncbi:hypothetical protein DLM78_14995 [Leptospira stimsonii]|uniref:Uncharacterized protein n=1 Tax=Leptospira stimsonii TaxID=2202203 RepID=A0A8B3CNT1_9LEPT|nr:hypothetical protein DLM78_14995 [Leptospira stimsonii]
MVYSFLRIRLPIVPSGNSYIGGIWRTSKKSFEIEFSISQNFIRSNGIFVLSLIVSLCRKFFQWSASKMGAEEW